jgi:hypothetical protein
VTRSLVDAAFEARAPTWGEPRDDRPRCAECDELLIVRVTGRPRKICRKPECKRASFNRWRRTRLGPPWGRLIAALGRSIAREIAAHLVGGAR